MQDNSDVCVTIVRRPSTAVPFSGKYTPNAKLIRTKNSHPPFAIGCPMTNNRSSWCYALCEPVHGLGACGRVAPHALRGRTQRSIDRIKREKACEC